MIYLRPYKRGSASARLLRQALQITNLKASTILRAKDIIINWGGGSEMPSSFDRDTMFMINEPEAITRAVSKVSTLEAIGAGNYFTDMNSLTEWLDAHGGWPAGLVVYCRTLTRASRGRGIVVAKDASELVNAPLYTYAYPCKREYRVHIFNNNIVDLVAKVRITDKSNPKYKATPDAYVRNSETGYVFARDAVKIPSSVRENLEYHSRRAIQSLRLTFGAVDIVRDVNNNYTVLEINTAPGIMGSALVSYVEAINTYVRGYLGNVILRDHSMDDMVEPLTVPAASRAQQEMNSEMSRRGLRREAMPSASPSPQFTASSLQG